MKKHAKLITVISLFIALSALLCSCTAPNTVSTDTKYKLTMVTELFPLSEGDSLAGRADKALGETTVSGGAWAALKEYRKKTYDDSTTDKLAAIKYYTPAEASGTDSTPYAAAFTASAKKQLELAAAGGAEIIVLPSDSFSGAYLEVKDATKKFGEIAFVIITVPGSKVSNAASLNAKTTAVVLDARQFGYLFGYYAAENGFSSVAYVGADNAASKAFVTGLDKAASDKGIKAAHTLTSSGPVESVIKADIEKASDGADLLIGDELTIPYIAASGKKYASIFADDKAEFSVTVDHAVLKAFRADVINECRQINAGTVKNLGADNGIFVYSGSETVITVPELPEVDSGSAE